MKRLEEMLKQEAAEIEKIEVPEELEQRMRTALQKHRKKRPLGLVAAAVLALLMFSYNFEAIAFYGKTLLGYDEVMSDTLQDLNNMGKGQAINKSYRFSNGVEVTLDGIMVDQNNLLAFYTIKNDGGSIEDIDLSLMEMKGFLGEYMMRSGQGKISDDYTEIKWRGRFEPPNPLIKNLTFNFSMRKDDGTYEEGEIPFTLNRSKAMGHTIKATINKSLKADHNDVHLKTITASPTATVIEGKIGTLYEFVQNIFSDNRHFHLETDLELYADGKMIEKTGSSMSSNTKGITFETRFDALPKEVSNLEVRLTNLTTMENVNEQVEVSSELKDYQFAINDQEIIIKKVEVKNGNTYITILTEEQVRLNQVTLRHEEGTIPLEKTIEGELTKVLDRGIMHERTLQFNGSGAEMMLQVGRIIYTKQYDEKIQIPVDSK